jgi:hypothetical protein
MPIDCGKISEVILMRTLAAICLAFAMLVSAMADDKKDDKKKDRERIYKICERGLSALAERGISLR